MLGYVEVQTPRQLPGVISWVVAKEINSSYCIWETMLMMQNRSFFAQARGHAPLKRDRDRATGTGPPNRATGTAPPGPGHRDRATETQPRDRATGTGPPGPGHRDRATGTGPPGPGHGPPGPGHRDRATRVCNFWRGFESTRLLGLAKGCIRLCDSSWLVLQ